VKRREFITLLGGAAAWPLAVRAQQAEVVRRIGILETLSAALNDANLSAFQEGMRKLGYIEGRNLVIEYRSADGHNERFPELAAELVGLKVDLIVTRGTPAALAAKHATGTIPIVMAASGGPVGAGVVASLAQPAGNITGLSTIGSDLYGKRIELLKEMIPGTAEIAAFLNMSNPIAPPNWKEIQTAAQFLGLPSRLLDVRTVDDIDRAFDAVSRESGMALVIGLDNITQNYRNVIAGLASKHRLPTMNPSREFVDAGGLISYGVSYPDLYRRATIYVDKIFKGASPSDLPIEQPTKLELAINLKTAKTLGLEIPPMLLARADEVIE
jgi:putative tryptophan/tyrosine transport system substrate-binding protein